MEYPGKRSPSICVRNRKELDVAVELIMRNAHSTLHKTIRINLKKHPGVQRRCELNDIYSELYVRASKCLREKGSIPNLEGWMNIAARYIILEKSRALTKRDEIHQDIHGKQLTTNVNSPLVSEHNSPNLLALEELINCLDPLEKAIIQLMSEGFGWKEVCQRLISQGLIDDKYVSQKTIERIKKKGNRVAQRLRKSLDVEVKWQSKQ